MKNKSAEEIVEGLNPEQKKAIKHLRGPLLIIAGAGTGKTSVITRRIAYLIASKAAKPSEILALTFTDKAANEMEARVDILVPYGYVDAVISTFHSFGDRILRDYAIDLGMRPDYRVLSHADQMVFFREHISQFPLKYFKSLSDPIRHIEALIGAISRAKDEDITPEEYVEWAKKRGIRKDENGVGGNSREEMAKHLEIALIYKKYQELKAEKGFIDFGDQVNLVLELFRKHKAILKRVQEKYKFILVDEFQDTNYAQFELLKLLTRKNKNIAVVGDDDQSIYKFRGAAITNILNFEKYYKNCKKIVLVNNYRSTQLILDTSYRLIQHNNPQRLEVKSGINKRLISQNKEQAKNVQHLHYDNVSSEADAVAKLIKEKKEKGKSSYKDFAILVRANSSADPFLKALNIEGIPYFYSGGGGLYVLPEIKLMLAFLRSVGDLADNASLYYLASSEIYNLSPLDMQKINTFSGRRNYTLHYVFSHLEEAKQPDSEFAVLGDIDEGSYKKVQNIMADIKYYLDFASLHSTGELLYQFLKRSGYLMGLTSHQSVENDKKISNLAAFFEKVRGFKEIAEIDKVSEFIKYLNLLKDAGEDPESSSPDIDTDAVSILTIHKAKGLEFPVVFMVSLVADKFPCRERREAIGIPFELIKENIPTEDAHLQEERRLFYVGMTRSKNELYLTSAVDYGGKRERKVSQFVLEALDLPKSAAAVKKTSALDQIEMFAMPDATIFPIKKISEKEVLNLSYYPIDDYLTCPLKYKYAHILKIPLLPNHTIMYGSAIHKAVQAYFLAKMNGHKFLEKELLETFLNNWSSEGFISRSHEESRLKAGKLSLKRFYSEQKKSKTRVKYVEKEFKFVEDLIQIKGRWDLVLEEGLEGKSRDKKGKEGKDGKDGKDGKVIIVDFKSTEVNSQEKADKKAKESVQLAIYALAWKKMFGKLPERLQLHFIDSDLIGSTVKTLDDVTKVWNKALKVSTGVRAGDFRADPNAIKCGYCAYREICPSSMI
ncbi:MAG: ATP-dependent DNA helicase [Candidatus Margulisiibacteriota bacterium]